MKTKYTILLLAIAVSALHCGAAAQNRVSVKQNTYALQGDSVLVDMSIALNGAKIPKRAFVMITPNISKKGTASMDLPAVIINGKNRHKAYRRLVSMDREPVYIGQVINSGARFAPESYRYSVAVPYEPWMAEAGFFIKEDQCECNGPIVPMSYELVSGQMENRNPVMPPPEVVVEMNFKASFKVPNPEPVKTRSESGKAYLDYAAGRSELRFDYKNNASELSNIGRLIQQLRDDPYTTITNIAIDGFASPEGSYATNMTLSGKRATALKDYIKSAYGINESMFRVTGRGEDWTTLIDMIEVSDEPWKNSALYIINNTDIVDGREKKLMELQGGAPYRFMLENWFPRLRRSDYEIKYTVIPFTVEEGKKTIETQPHLMSLNEMFLVADSYPAGSEQYNRVFTIASRQFPDNDIANLNAAANALSRGDHSGAKAYLDKVQDRDASWENNMGVMHAIQGEYDQAAVRFAKAKEGGNAEGVSNLAETEKLDSIKK